LATGQSLRRIAQLAHKLEKDMATGGMTYPWKSLFRTNAILTRIVAHLAEHLAREAEVKAVPTRMARPSRTRVSSSASRAE
jgi:hypothetical protein